MSMIERSNEQTTSTQVVDALAWAELLDTEGNRFLGLGIRSGLISLDFTGEDATITRDRAVRLLRRLLRPTDHIGLTSATSIAILQAPLPSISELDRTARQVDGQLQDAGLAATVGFAHRRVDEELRDTWARADAQADRAQFRQQVGGDGEIFLS